MSIEQLQREGLVPSDAGVGGRVPFGEYFVCWWGWITPDELSPNKMPPDDFHGVYLQIESTEDFMCIAVKMNINESECPYIFDKEIVRRARKRIQDHFVRKVGAYRVERTRFQFNSPKLDEEHAGWLTVSRTYFDEENYADRIRAVQQAFEELKTDFRN